ncbi:MAG: helix-turn-helix domain-containing protein [Lachnospiraceae bacterium]|nr:helix-turn-helix domain-containing protein [Lachnospiraceae bacterium]
MEYLITTEDIELVVESQCRNVCEELVDRLKEIRLDRGMSQQDIANITGIQRPNIARFEACSTTPTIENLLKYASALGYKLSFSLEEDEIQRVGRNKKTLIDRSYIASGAYRQKFDIITTSRAVNKLVYQKAKEMLHHRTGTEYEDMYWLDMRTCSIICSKLDETNTSEIRHTKSIDKLLKNQASVLAMHTHPHSMPPSADDFNTFYRAGYKMGIVVCHDGTVYRYSAVREISEALLERYIYRYYMETGDERKAQLMALDKFVERGDIYYEEVTV